MKNGKKLLSLLLVLILVLGQSTSVLAAPSSTFITTPATGYDSADDVVYKTYTVSGKKVIANWGARGETCIFLSDYAEDYYTGSYEWDIMSDLSGGTSQSNAPSSSLYNKLQDLMEGTHTFYTYYDGNKNVRDYYKYTDCVSSDTSKVALLYRGGLVSSAWDSGKTWNQEHVWPKSKLSTDKQIGDIMHLRPANPSENSSRGNTAFGSTSGYDPGVSVRGDCARMVLYMYVRWGATSTMWGSSGVMQNLNTLLAWMEADPVDTWEMGRNDAVQSVTGVRNVFVDYPEYAWLLFGEEVPANMTTPSGEASEGSTGGNGSGTVPPETTPPETTPPATTPPETNPPETTPPATTPPETNPPETDPPVSDIPSNKDGFVELVGLITNGTYQGQARFDAIAQAVEIYNNLSTSDQASVSVAYTRLKTAIVTGNEDAAKVNNDAQSARDTFLPGAIVGFALLTFAGYSLLGKKFF